MKNQKVGTVVGTGILIIISVTAFVFVWVYEKSLSQTEISQPTQVPLPKAVQKTTETPVFPKTIEPVEERKIYRNDTYGFEIQYPSNYLFQSPLVSENAEYSIWFGPSYEEVFGVKQSNLRAQSVFGIAVFKNESGLDNFIKKTESMLGGIEHTLEIIGTEQVAGISAKVAKICNMGGFCDKRLYFIHGKYLYVIDMDNYFGLENEVIKNGLDRMLASFSFSTK